MENSNRNNAISLIRLVSLLMIVICHIMQYANFVLAWWFNVGVQIFLCLSGYLYGQKKIWQIPTFYKNRFLKILIPYYIVFVSVGILEAIFFKEEISISRFIDGFFCQATLSGGQHLWFVPLILFCYVLTPILSAYKDEYITNSWSLCFGTLIAIGLVSLIFRKQVFSYYDPAWISCYFVGYALGINEERQYISIRKLLFVFLVVSFIGNGLQIFCDYICHFSFSGYLGTAYLCFKNYNHVFLGVFLFLFMKKLFEKIVFNQFSECFLELTDAYSYETYLVHHFLILGPFSLLAVSSNFVLNVFFALVGIVTLAVLLKKIEISIKNI